MSMYLLKSCAFVIAFYIPFFLILRRTTFFNINRVYLVSGLLVSSVLPLYKGFISIPVYTPPDLPFMEPIATQTELVISRVSEPIHSLNTAAFFIIFYLLGIGVLLIRLIFSVTGILKLKQQGKILSNRDIKVIKTNTSVPFSFFKYVFLPEDLSDSAIFEHEAAHVRQHHWIDLLIVELVSIILWFNPVMIFYKRSLKQQHEYLADWSAIKSGIDIGKYLMRMSQQIELAISAPLMSEFYFQSIKNRINMLTKKRTSVFGLAMYIIVLPIVVCLLMAFSPRRNFQLIEDGKVFSNQGQISLCLPIDKKYNFLLQSGYGERLHPVLGVRRLHTGIDLVAEEGVPVVSTEEGVVVKAHMAHAWGNIVVVQHDDTYSTSYSHLKSMNVKEGDRVQKGQVIGFVGHTGLSSKNHLHFELLENGKAVDPISYLPQIR